MATTLRQNSDASTFALLAYNEGGKPANGAALPDGFRIIGGNTVGFIAAFAYKNDTINEVFIAYPKLR